MAAPAGQQALVADVALADGGVLAGQVVDAQGAAVANSPVAVSMHGREVVRVATNADGAFSAAGLKGGVYEVSAAGSSSVFRLWAPETSPPAARNGVMLVSGSDVVRGQYGPAFGPPAGPMGPAGPPVAPPGPPAPPQGPFGKAFTWISNHPIITASAVGAAIAVPIAVQELDDDAS
jgi:hypothetical protein